MWKRQDCQPGPSQLLDDEICEIPLGLSFHFPVLIPATVGEPSQRDISSMPTPSLFFDMSGIPDSEASELGKLLPNFENAVRLLKVLRSPTGKN